MPRQCPINAPPNIDEGNMTNDEGAGGGPFVIWDSGFVIPWSLEGH
jgi:hypothetical protein